MTREQLLKALGEEFRKQEQAYSARGGHIAKLEAHIAETLAKLYKAEQEYRDKEVYWRRLEEENNDFLQKIGELEEALAKSEAVRATLAADCTSLANLNYQLENSRRFRKAPSPTIDWEALSRAIDVTYPTCNSRMIAMLKAYHEQVSK